MGSYLSSFFNEACTALLRGWGLIMDHHRGETQEMISSTSSSEKLEDEKACEEESSPEYLPTNNSENLPAVTLRTLAKRTPPVSDGSGGKINSTSS
ncbi:hypothetical protein SADUNF_Sadunf13G0093800 [Salix dunnii]|uniref:Uncharacterized protein n=1 Tax=Salix dunnii TaxID=1413687 RepID=A0A835JLL7_9ROSI|nr:hypothetical protein SADUNF_Sadunf13G0093800 [Salix dunnii]